MEKCLGRGKGVWASKGDTLWEDKYIEKLMVVDRVI